MTYFELVDAVRAAYAGADASNIKEHVAFQFNVTGEAEGAFYLEIKDGKVFVEPYDYHDRDVLFTTTAETLLKIGRGELDPMWAYTTRKLRAEGNLGKALLLKEITPKRASAVADGGVAAETAVNGEANKSTETTEPCEAAETAANGEVSASTETAEPCEAEETAANGEVSASTETAEPCEAAETAANGEAEQSAEDMDEQAVKEEDAAAGDGDVPAALTSGSASDRAVTGKKRPNRKSKKKRR